jgi:two-component system, NtrC family, response regulator AtoC
MSHILVVDDDPALRYTLEAVLSDAGLQVTLAEGGQAGIDSFERSGADVVLTDLAMPEVDGMKVLERIRALDPSVPIVMLTAHGSERVAVAAIKAGAYDYLPKPFDPEDLVHAVQRSLETRALRVENANLRTVAALGRPVVAESVGFKRLLEMATRVASKDVTVLVTGESGSGKEVVAATIHAHSKRSERALVKVNASAIPAELAESELFGHVKGAFTGAIANRQGYFQQAHKGTLFIDEIGDLPLAIQAKLLRVLQTGEVQPVGGRTEVVDVRVIAATHRDLVQEVRTGQFREDLLYRLNVVPLRVPPLRERTDDIEALTRLFVRLYADRYGMGAVTIEPALIDTFRAHAWPGNVRELENNIARMLALTPDDALTQALWNSIDNVPESAVAAPASGGHDPGSKHPLRARIEYFERSILSAEFVGANQNQSETARRLGISRPALIERLHKYGLLKRS